MVSNNHQNPTLQDENIEELNLELLNILSELSSIVSMEEQYRLAGMKMKNTSALVDLMERMNTLQMKINERI
ncbi:MULTISPECIES: hypothetical protein [unclassified Sulfuricurvum]|uniref:hypothetical protein n=1 Tax=unclassified Sulfuricurvum TaxID=2632390 RepID=UPI000299733E|nr:MULTISPECIES: hypothetical protein [unclassified Sulfuricurvum]OHD84928.1 MAG: hypothetical protein A3D90_06430 [Sulfuricurvum sp. RIFCSPHIGHO2_02_FULL_43_9]OHD86381.1 MAG: hypothetical protein A3I60_01605 [Sulfuricurvum sp. RIFCSPLOWO2_02_FULL_43_45]OHD87278.1 MAG: hypothetical protein A3J39_08615 [Sulfuricurvum sp. RIFCSPHIGHO2_12_FULL_44_8]AFV97606.1 hypothetical protein B649_06460 [Candidatus Sulfuricurvum sp. RIFRC-1]OHD89446.1 MAG: hypothetical protein A3G19_00190 [Sulfuricurvum sp. R